MRFSLVKSAMQTTPGHCCTVAGTMSHKELHPADYRKNLTVHINNSQRRRIINQKGEKKIEKVRWGKKMEDGLIESKRQWKK